MRERAIRISDVERWTGAAVATAALAFGLSRRSAAGVALAAGAVPLAYRSLAGHWPSFRGFAREDTRVALGGDRGIHVRESIRIECPIEEVYAFWRDFENLPRFMSNLERVTEDSHR